MQIGNLNKIGLSVTLENRNFPQRCRKIGRAWLIRIKRIRIIFTTRKRNKREEKRLVRTYLKIIKGEIE